MQRRGLGEREKRREGPCRHSLSKCLGQDELQRLESPLPSPIPGLGVQLCPCGAHSSGNFHRGLACPPRPPCPRCSLPACSRALLPGAGRGCWAECEPPGSLLKLSARQHRQGFFCRPLLCRDRAGDRAQDALALIHSTGAARVHQKLVVMIDGGKGASGEGAGESPGCLQVALLPHQSPL